jgi:hypothetical protein
MDRDVDVLWVRYSKRPSVRRKVDPYLGIIQTRLAQFPKLSLGRIFGEIRAAGYDIRYTQVK